MSIRDMHPQHGLPPGGLSDVAACGYLFSEKSDRRVRVCVACARMVIYMIVRAQICGADPILTEPARVEPVRGGTPRLCSASAGTRPAPPKRGDATVKREML
jgi:hypothetical protein